VSAALVIQHVLCIRCIILSSVITFFHIISQTAQFLEKSYWTKNCVMIFSTNFVCNFDVILTVHRR